MSNDNDNSRYNNNRRYYNDNRRYDDDLNDDDNNNKQSNKNYYNDDPVLNQPVWLVITIFSRRHHCEDILLGRVRACGSERVSHDFV